MDPEEVSGDAPVSVAVEVETPAPVEESDTPAVVVVETAPEATSDPVEAVEVATLIELAGRVSALEVAVAGLIETTEEVAVQAEVAENLADLAVDLAVEAEETTAEIEPVVEEVAEEVLPDDVPPNSAKPHWMFRSRKDWKN